MIDYDRGDAERECIEMLGRHILICPVCFEMFDGVIEFKSPNQMPEKRISIRAEPDR